MTVTLKQHQETQSRNRVEPGSVNIPIAKFPSAVEDLKDTDPRAAAFELVVAFDQALKNHDYQAVSNLFAENSYWRDHLALSWELRTLKGQDKILAHLQQKCLLTGIEMDDSSTLRRPNIQAMDAAGLVKGIQTFLNVSTQVGKGRGIVRMIKFKGAWKIFSLFTALQEINEHEEPVAHRRTNGVEHRGRPDRRNWLEKREADAGFKHQDPTVLILGCGQAGLTAAARLKMLSLSALVIDRAEQVGDNWRNRYHQLVLHDPIWYDHLPYIPFPAHWPVFTPKDKLAEFFETYVKLLELNVWTGTSIKTSAWNAKERLWTVVVETTKLDGSIEERTFHPKHVIQATGHSGEKNFPSGMKGIANFIGDRLCHSSEFSGAKALSKGQQKKVVVVGSCNSAHDICQDFSEKGYDVTMAQRSTTCVTSSASILRLGLAGLYDEDGPPTEDADLILHATPSEVLKSMQVTISANQAKYDSETLSGLERAGFGLDRGPDEAGLLIKYFQRGGGYYIDVGASQLIIDGKIKIKQGQEISEVLSHGLRFADGTELEADEIIFATGYKNMKSQTRTIFGDEVADQVKDVWGFDEEGEMRSIWHNSGHPGFWFMGGNLALCRYYSRVLALQIKGLELGLYENK